MTFQFPKDGSIVIIDDQFSEAKPLIDMLSKNGSSSTYYNGDLGTLPDNMPLSKVRLIFADIQLIPALTADNYAGLIIDHIERLVSKDNGPYVLIIWSGTQAIYSDTLIERVNTNGNHQKPIAIIALSKNDYYKNTNDESVNVKTDEIINDLNTRLNQQDLLIIKNLIDAKFSANIKMLNPNALQKISRKISTGLQAFKSFQLLLEWENAVYEASSKHVSDLANIHEYDEYWDINFKNLISRMAYAQNEQNSVDLTGLDLLNATFKTINNAFSDTLNITTTSKIRRSPWRIHDFKNTSFIVTKNSKLITISWKDFADKYSLLIDRLPQNINTPKELKKLDTNALSAADKPLVKSAIEDYNLIASKLNTKFLIDTKTKKPHQPGIVYEIKVRKNRKRNLLKAYSKKFMDKDQHGNYTIADNYIDDCKFIEVEVSPICDYAQKKWLKSRFISGIIYNPSSVSIEKSDYIYKLPQIQYNGSLLDIAFDFRLLKALDIDAAEIRSNILFRIKNDALTDIVTRMSSHASRIGITAVH